MLFSGENFMKCPRCKNDLTQELFEGHKIESCKKCGGIWLHKHQLNELISESHSDVEKCSIDNHEHKDKYPAIKCITCEGQIMKKINFLEYSDIIMDYCPGCGSFWIDRDEIKLMHEYIKKVEEGSHDVKDHSAYSILAKISQIAYRIYH